MKKILITILAICLALSFASCTKDEPDTEIAEPSETYYEKEEVKEPEKEEEPLENLPEPTMISADFDVTTNPDGTFLITTNLPRGTELSLKLNGKGYLAQGKAFVGDGTALSERFTNRGEQLVGDYTLEVLMPIPSVQNDYVKHFIGSNGEYLTGPYLKPALGSVVVSKEFKVSFPPKSSQEVSVDSGNNDKVQNVGASYKYYITPTGTKYHSDPACGGKNSFQTSNISGYSPCKKCAN